MAEEEVSKKMESLTVSEGETKTWEPMAFPEDRIAHWRKCFDGHPDAKELDGKKALAAKVIHQLFFTQAERMEYGFKDFESDLKGTMEDADKPLTWEDVEKYMKENF
ncbi:unnamed protein product [Symbiodinium natans]|uniref:Uncharacterized protein n=1 Tax=Symbiodinium natans TaxID=878477 RepID=A0A812GZW8_9DINO|nr:unnamed protein product [Symbiodinium natans]